MIYGMFDREMVFGVWGVHQLGGDNPMNAINLKNPSSLIHLITPTLPYLVTHPPPLLLPAHAH